MTSCTDLSGARGSSEDGSVEEEEEFLYKPLAKCVLYPIRPLCKEMFWGTVQSVGDCSLGTMCLLSSLMVDAGVAC